MKFDYARNDEQGNKFESRNPARPDECVGRYSEVTDRVVVDGMIEKARRAQAEWAKVPGVQRGDLLNSYLITVEQNVDRIAESITLEQGKTIVESRNEILKGCAEGRFIASEAARQQVQTIASARSDVRNLILHRPRGTIFAICPWNFPAMTPLRKLCPAIAFGNAMLIKPSQFTPAAAFMLAEIAEDFFPEGLLQVMPCPGRMASELVASARFDGVSFTGSVEIGRKVAEAAATSLVPAQLELGGKNAVIINDVIDLDSCLDQVFAASFQTSGQRCTSISRVIVKRDLHSAVVDGLAARVRKLSLGDGMAAGTGMGPLCHQEHWQSVRDMTAKAITEGAELIVGGDIDVLETCPGGYFYKATILNNADRSPTASREEIFGPVLSIMSYDSFDQALKLLNSTRFGLTSSLFSDSHCLIQRFLQESQHGMLHVNNGTVPDVNMPFGGMKSSGVGSYSVGASVAAFYTVEQSAYLAW
ncbi:aldehyde dehydrogenase [Pseudomonas sp. M30-35]|uniref:aldehyde dehydrogenase family protein n=1 Tax=Pseudomonas sp. M30-35 TaxID=1981174 RepID=UPI000B3CF744|nr:aldehyde dehydrogenase family protein [Pseudomonas sp. M30-35]ARU90535.1 aldehyde dehydrogenase [Pseudomonas sp. M30-35]